MSVLQTALAYANKQVRVIPIKQGEKRPPMQGWQNAATSDPTTIRNGSKDNSKTADLASQQASSVTATSSSST
jgi:hypothetical protein